MNDPSSQIAMTIPDGGLPLRNTRLHRHFSWKSALATAVAILYGPFFAMALYMQANVSCDHCKKTAWTMLPTAPGFVALIAVAPIRLSDSLSMLIGGILSITLALSLAYGMRKTGRWSMIVFVPVFLLTCLGALGLYGAIRL